MKEVNPNRSKAQLGLRNKMASEEPRKLKSFRFDVKDLNKWEAIAKEQKLSLTSLIENAVNEKYGLK